jgi:hypothetical protein
MNVPVTIASTAVVSATIARALLHKTSGTFFFNPFSPSIHPWQRKPLPFHCPEFDLPFDENFIIL